MMAALITVLIILAALLDYAAICGGGANALKDPQALDTEQATALQEHNNKKSKKN